MTENLNRGAELVEQLPIGLRVYIKSVTNIGFGEKVMKQAGVRNEGGPINEVLPDDVMAVIDDVLIYKEGSTRPMNEAQSQYQENREVIVEIVSQYFPEQRDNKRQQTNKITELSNLFNF